MKFFLLGSNSNRSFLRSVFGRVLVSFFILAIAGSRSFGQCGTPNPCYECSGQIIVVDQDVTIDFNTAIPTYSGDPDLQPYFTYDNSGPTPDTWKAIFDVGNRKLLIKNGATITVTNVPNSGNNRYAPGILIRSTCSFEMEPGSHIIVNSLNKQAGDIVILINGDIIINGEVRNEVSGTNGLPGAITISSKCGNLIEGSTGLIVILGSDIGGNLISLLDCGANNNGNIVINGLVKSYAVAHAGDLTMNRPNIRVVAFNGSVTINANTVAPLFDEFPLAGGLYDIYGGLLSWVKDNVNPGKVEVQGRYDVTVNGHGTDPTGPVRESFGAIAAIGTASSAPGGLVDVRSTEGRIIGNDRSFDVSGRNRLSTNFAHIRLWAKSNILLNRLGANDNFNPVVDASSPSVGDKGGTNEIRSFSGSITIGANALVSAAVPPGSGSVQGTNLLTSCGGVTNNGTVNPADLVNGDDAGTCGTLAPAAIYTDCITITGIFDIVVDVTPPVFTFCPPGSDLGCNPPSIPVAGNATATDNSGTVFITSSLGDPVNTNGCNWTSTRVYVATDGCGNSATCTQIFTYRIDHTKPTITVTPPGTLPCNPTQGQINGAFGTATATDDCSTDLTPTGVVGAEFGSGCNFATTKTWTVTDNCGNTQTASQTLFYTRDLVKPTITVTPPGTLPCNPTDAQILAAFGTASATDNCCATQGVRGVNDDANREESVSDCVTFQISTGDEQGTGCTRTRARIWTATDACGNTQTATQTLTFTRDVIKPTITISASTTAPCNPTQTQINNAFGTAGVTDNCSVGLTATGVVGSETGGPCTFQTTKTWTVTDDCGNTQTASQTVTYSRDVIKPTITISASGTLPCNPTQDQINASFGTASVTDNCSVGLTATGVVGQETGGPCQFSTTKTWTVTDNCGNTQTNSQTVTYTRDVIKPTITISASTSLPCNPTQSQINNAFGTASVTDNCSVGLTATGVVGSETGGPCQFSTTKTWTVTDNCGNTQTNSQTVTYIRDTQKPVISITPAGTLPCNPTQTQINNAFGNATASDNCTIELVPQGAVGPETGGPCLFSTTKTWTVTDNCGNTQTNSQTVTYTRDTQKPVISITPAGALPCNPTQTQINNAFGNATASDNCTIELVPQGVVGSETGGPCLFSTTKTWTVTDNCGNTQTNSQTVTYTRDTQKPVISITPAGTLPCNPTQTQINNAFGNATASDNCTIELVPQGVVGPETGGPCQFSTTKTWTVTDNCGNTQTNSQTVTYTRDVIKPTITISASTTLPCNPTQDQINAAFGTASVTDNCSVGLQASGSVGSETGGPCQFSTTKTWTVTDNCGNTQTNSQTVTYTRDVIKPTITISASTTLPCNPTQTQINNAFGTASVTDNCSVGLTATGVVGSETGGPCQFSTTKTWTVTDNCGNTQTNSQTVTYTRDVIKPTITITPPSALPCNPTQDQINAAFGTASVTDNCSVGLQASGSVGQEFGSGCNFATTKTWTVTDNCGNTQTASQTIFYTRDLIKPTITVTPPGNLPCNPTDGQILAAFGSASATDNCCPQGGVRGVNDGNREEVVSDCVTLTSQTGDEQGTGCTRTRTRIWTATDACGNTQTATQTLTYTRDVIKPTITISASTTLPCNPTQTQINNAFGTASVTDNCSDGLQATGVVGSETGGPCQFSTTKTWTVTDNCGNTQTNSQTVTYTRDVIKPTITISASGTLPCNPTQDQINAAFGTASVTDNCSVGLTATGVVGSETGGPCQFSTTKTWTVTDNCGNTQTNSQTVTYTRDVIKPTITISASTTLPCNPTQDQINAAFGTASVTDNCSVGLQASGSVGSETGGPCQFSTTKTWTVTDNCGNTQTNSQTVTYTRDVIKPTITISASTTLPCNPTQTQINNAFGTASVTDNCSVGLTATGVVGSETGGPCQFSTTKTWTVTDNCGNTQTNSQTVTYTRDVIKPTITITPPSALPCNPTQDQINAAFGTASVTDNCSVGLQASGSVGQEFGSGCNFATTKTWTVTDNCGNTQTASQTIFYTRDLVKPTITVTPPGNLPCNPTDGQILAAFGSASATDNCCPQGGVRGVNDGNRVEVVSDCVTLTSETGDEQGTGCTRTRTRIWTATDACGNTQTATQTLTYTRDVIKPTITISASTTLPCNPTQTQINNAFGTASVTDNCSDGLQATGVVGSETGGPCQFSTTKTWTVTDNCGNTQTNSQTVTYTRDVIKPTITISASGTLPCNPTQDQINAAFGTASVTDNCSVGLTATGVVGSETGGPCQFSTTKTWTVTDNCGNTQTNSQTVTYTRDVIKPTITISASTTLPCNPTQDQINAAFGTASVTDNCSVGLQASGSVGSETGGPCQFSTTKTWTVTDNCGNTQTNSQTVTYTRDVIKPTITISASGTLPCNPTQDQINAAFGTASVTDNCSVGLTATGVVGSETGGPCQFSTTKTWTVTDNCGNTQTNSQTVTYTRDVIKPTITISASTTLPCNPTQTQINNAFGTASVTDNCSVGLTATGVVGSETGGPCQFSTTKIWTVTDNCGNTQTNSQTVTYTRDVIKPTITISASTTLPCNPTQDQINAAFGTASVTDNCSVGLSATGVVGSETGGPCQFSTTKTWTVTDNCGNTQTNSQTVTYTRDVIKPTITISASTTLPCNPTQTQINNAFGTASVTDNCSVGLTATGVVGSETGGPCQFSTTKTWTVTDNCGNTQTNSQTVTYTRDVIKPTITISAAGTLPCNPTQDQINAAFGTASVTDNCSVGLTASGSVGQEFGSGCNFATTKTWTVTDNCGNTQTASQTIFYTRDLVKPTITLTAQGTLPCNPTDAQINTAFGTASATDNCCPQGGVRGVNDGNREEIVLVDCVTVTAQTLDEQGTGCTRTKTRIWTATDACGNTQTATRTLTYTRDVIKPTITISAAGTLPCNPTQTQINNAFGTASVTDNCTETLQATGVVGSESGQGCTFQTTKTWTATDNCGNTQTASQTLTYTRDVTPPVITPTGTSLTLGCNPTSGQINAALGTATATDNCCLLSNLPTDGAIISNGCNRSQTRTWVATDCCGNTATASRTATWIRDVTPPEETTPCIQCDGVIVVDQNVTINFNTAVPTYTGDPDLQPYFAYDNSGPTADTWKAIFNLGTKKLLVKNGTTITVTNVPTTGNNQYAPGILIRSLCGIEIENGGHIVVNSLNKNSGDIVISVNGDIIINGEIRNEVSGTNGIPGAITITSKCGNITEGSTGLVEIIGQDFGGNTISIVTCGDRGGDGDITINGLVKSFARAHAGDQTLHRPNIRVISFNGKVTVNANTVEPLYDEFQESGTRYDIWGGLLSWVRDNVIPGMVEVQAKKDITVNGHGDDPIGTVRRSFGAIAAVGSSSSQPGGLVDVRSLQGKIIGNDRAFDVSGRNRLATNYAHIILWSKGDIVLSRLGATSDFNPVVDASSPTVGDKGGLNELRSFAGHIIINANAQVSAAVPFGNGSVQGINLLTTCAGLTNNGSVVPADLTNGDDAGVCGSPAPAATYTDCTRFFTPEDDLGCNPTEDAINAAFGTVTGQDACGPVQVTFVDGPVVVDGCHRSKTRTWTITDNCGNTTTVNKTVTWEICPCAPGRGQQIVSTFGENAVNRLEVTAFPNPYEEYFTLRITPPVSGQATIKIYNLNGTLLGEIKKDAKAYSELFVSYYVPALYRTRIVYNVSIGSFSKTGIVLSPN